MAIMDDGYNKVIHEYFDIKDRDTRKILLSVNEADQAQVLSALASKMYDHIVKKVDDIDFGSIPQSKGDIAKIENFSQLMDCLDTMNQIIGQSYGQKYNPVQIVMEAVENIRSRKDMFEKAFKFNVELPMVTYCTMVLGIVQANAYLISTVIDFIKEPNKDGYKTVYNRSASMKTKDALIVRNLVKFNESCKKKEFDKAMDYVIHEATKHIGGASVSIVVAITSLTILTLNILPMLQEMVFFFYWTRTRISDYFAMQAELLRYNAQNVSDRGDDESEKIANKQRNIANVLQKIANKIAIDDKTASSKASKEMDDEDKKYKTDELMDSAPDSSTSSIF